jgi:Tfp pilus assembly protein PilF
MKTTSAVFAAAALAAGMLATPAKAKDVYKPYLDPVLFAHHRAALDTLEKLKENPNDAGLHNDLGCLVARDAFWRDALREFDEAARLDKKDGKPLFNAGLVYAARGEWHSARRAFHTAVRRDGGNWTGWWMLGYAEERLGNVDAAVRAYKHSLKNDTTLFDVSRNPFAADTRLKARVLLETYEMRLLRASYPTTEQLAQPARIATFFQRSRPAPAERAPAEAAAQAPEPPTSSGPVVTTAPAAGAPGASRSSGAQPGAAPGDRIQFRPVAPRGVPQRPTPDPAQAAPPPTPAPPVFAPQSTGETGGPGQLAPRRRLPPVPNATPAAPVAVPTPQPDNDE